MTKYYVWNRTDQVYAAPGTMTEEAAEKFCDEFTPRSKQGGQYCEEENPAAVPEVWIAAVPGPVYRDSAR